MASEPVQILLICAERESAARLAAAIQPSGHRVVATPFGPTAMEMAHGSRLVVVDRVEARGGGVAAVRRVKATPGLTSMPVLAVAQGGDVEERIALLEAGADDVVSRPVEPQELQLRIGSLLSQWPQAVPEPVVAVVPVQPERPKVGPKILAFLSPKGGAGTTTLAVNVATLLARGGRSVAIVDLDLQFGAVGMHLDVRTRSSIVELVRDELALEDPDTLRVHAEVKDGLAVFISPLTPDQAELVTADHLRRLFAVASTTYDVTVVDAGSGFDERMLTVLRVADRAAIVTTPELPSLRAVRSLVEALAEYGTDAGQMMFVLNHVFAADMLTRDEVRGALGEADLVEIPHDPLEVQRAANTGVPVVVDAPRSPAAERLARLAAVMMGDPEPTSEPDPSRRLRLSGLLRRG